MKVATKFSLAFLACGVLSVLLYSAVAASREVARLDATVMEDLASLGRIIGRSVMEVWDKQGEERARDLVAYADRDETIEARWTWLDAPKGSSTAPRADPVVVDAVKRGVASTWIARRPDGTRAIYAYVPLLKHGERPAALELSRPVLDEKSVFLAEIREELVASTGVVALATLVALLLTQVIVSRPLARVAAQARRIGTGDLSHRIPERGRDEVASLVRDLNAMCDQIDEARSKAKNEAQKSITALEQLRHADRLRTVGTLASGIAHEVGTPLGVIVGRVEQALDRTSDERAKAALGVVLEQVDRIRRIVRGCLALARGDAPHLVPTPPASLAEHATDLVRHRFANAGIELACDVDADLPVVACEPALFEQALVNVLLNACQATPRGGNVRLSVRNVENEVRFVVEDDGSGISDETARRATEPFFSTRREEGGSGLGLTIAREIVSHHAGSLTVENRKEHRGTRATISVHA